MRRPFPRPPATRDARPPALAPLAAVTLAALASGCGGVAPEAKSYAPGPAGIDEALGDLSTAERELAAQLGAPSPETFAVGSAAPSAPSGAGDAPGAPPFAQPPAQQPPPPPPAEPPRPVEPMAAAPPEPADAAPSAPEAEERGREDRCELSCRALSSMRRAAEHVCRAAGAGDERCARARGRVAAAERRVDEACDGC